MPKVRQNGIILALAASTLALLTALFLADEYFRAQTDPFFRSVCSVDEKWLGLPVSCERASESAFGKVLGLPVAFWGVAFYAVLTALSVVALIKRALLEKVAALIAGAGVFAVLYSVFLLSVLIFVLHVLCPFCMALYGLNALLCLGGLWAYGLRPRAFWDEMLGMLRRHVREPILAASVLGFAALLTMGFAVSMRAERGPSDADYVALLTKLPELPAVNVEVRPGDASFGPSDAPYTIVEFSDFLCPGCRQAAGDVERLRKTIGGEVHFVFKHLPIDDECNTYLKKSLHPGACLAAFASVCAQPSGHFWEMHDRLFAAAKELRQGDEKRKLVAIASELGIDAKQFAACLESEETRSHVSEDFEAAYRIGVRSTPAFLLNGRPLYRAPYALGSGAAKALGPVIRANLKGLARSDAPPAPSLPR